MAFHFIKFAQNRIFTLKSQHLFRKNSPIGRIQSKIAKKIRSSLFRLKLNHFFSLFQLMSLRTAGKKPKINASAEKIRPPPLISDFTSGAYLTNASPTISSKYFAEFLH